MDAAISRDGKLVAFLADRDSVFDAFVTQVGTEQFANITAGQRAELFNDDVRNVGFTADGTHLWLRVGDIAPDLKVAAYDGSTLRLGSLWEGKPVMLIFGSCT